MAPDLLSYNMSDVNPHLTQCEPPPYLKAGSAPEEGQCSLYLLQGQILFLDRSSSCKVRFANWGCWATPTLIIVTPDVVNGCQQ